MSGICGIINFNNQQIDESDFKPLYKSLKHRTLNAANSCMESNIALGQMMLLDTPESNYEVLPLKYKHWILVADARIDNRDELKNILNIKPADLTKTPDSIFIIKAFEKWGTNCVNHLTGAFAFAIWDAAEQQLFCAKDHMGIRPFFYIEKNGIFIFASEQQALVHYLDGVVLNERKLVFYTLGMHWHQAEHKNTFVKGIKRLLPGHWLSANKNGVQQHLYWDNLPRKNIRYKNENEYYEHFKSLLSRAVTDRLRTNFTVGCTLSGGLDSSVVSCLAASKLKQSGQVLESVSSTALPGNLNKVQGEKQYIEAVLQQHTNINHHWVLGKNNVYEGLTESFERSYVPPNYFFMMDEAICQKLKQQNARVVLSGFYGDTAVSYHGDEVMAHLFTHFNWLNLWKLLNERKQYWKNKSSWWLFKNEVIKRILPDRLKKVLFQIMGQQVQLNNIKSTLANCVLPENVISKYNLAKQLQQYNQQMGKPANAQSRIANIQFLYPTEQMILTHHYYNQVAAYPLADKRLLDFMLSIPIHLLLKGFYNRSFFRKAIKNVIPEKVRLRYDKQPYIPDFQFRLQQTDSIKLESFVVPLVKQIIKVNEMEAEFTQLKTQQNVQQLSGKGYRFFGYGYLATQYLNWFYKINK